MMFGGGGEGMAGFRGKVGRYYLIYLSKMFYIMYV